MALPKWKIWLYLMVALYVAAGINHFANTSIYMDIMPPWVPYHLPMVYISGVCEIVLGLLLLPLATRRIAAWGIILLLIAVFPANVQTCINNSNTHDLRFWISVARLPLQLVLIRWAWLYARKRTNKIIII